MGDMLVNGAHDRHSTAAAAGSEAAAAASSDDSEEAPSSALAKASARAAATETATHAAAPEHPPSQNKAAAPAASKDAADRIARKKAKKLAHQARRNGAGGIRFREVLRVEIPLDSPTTLDLEAVLSQCRTRYLEAIYRRYPQLRPARSSVDTSPIPPPSGTQSSSASLKQRKARAEDGAEDLGDVDEAVDDEDDSNRKDADREAQASSSSGKKDPPSSPPRKKPLKHVPQPRDYGNMLEYLEAKYVQGVMVDENEGDGDGDDDEDDDEGAGSVYSDLSDFMDDTDLRRTVASQVLAHSTATRLELSQQNDNDDNAFFVNVGALEVEETEYTKEQYDPLQDVDSKKKPKATKKRKKPDGAATVPSATTGKTALAPSKPSEAAASKTVQPKKKPKLEDKAKSGESDKTAAKPASTKTAADKAVGASKSTAKKPKTAVTAATSEDAASVSTAATPKAVPSSSIAAPSGEASELQLAALQRKEVSDELYRRILQQIPHEQFPRRKTKERVALICPADKKPGDSILFSNPHVPGQRLKVQIPKSTAPGGSFKVTVPVKEELDETVDYNKLSREFYDAVDDYARAYDDWCDAHGAWRKALGDTEYAPHLEKRKKFDDLMRQFPSDLKTPVDKDYMKKILRRARQNRSKREQTALRHQAGGSGSVSVHGDGPDDEEDAPPPATASSSSVSPTTTAKAKAPRPLLVSPKSADKKPSASVPPGKVAPSGDDAGDPPAKTKPVTVPSLARSFASVRFASQDFA